MSRREIRLRKEFLYKKQLQSSQLIRNEKKRKIRSAVERQTSIPTELIPEARALHHESEMDVIPLEEVQEEEGARQAVDDEYAEVGLKDPKVCVTTSRDPSSRLKQFAKEIKICIPNAQAINRGNFRTDDIMNACRNASFTDVIFLNETRGQPDGLTISHLPFGPTAFFTLSNCVLRHDIPETTPASQAYPHLILDSFESPIGKRIAKILQALYPVPRPDSRRVLTFRNSNDFISFRHHMYTKEKGKVAIKEVGPRFEMQPYEIRLGTIDQDTAEKEWVLRPFMNTARKKRVL